MSTDNPIHLVEELNFSSQPNGSLTLSSTPDCLRISPNGSHVSINNYKHIYLFNLHNPEQGWQPGIEVEGIDRVTPTDLGNYWILGNSEIMLVDKLGDNRLEFPALGIDSIWGNDEWIVMHDSSELSFTSMSNLKIIRVKFNKVILHAWMAGNQLRLLSASKSGSRLYLHEWNPGQTNPALKQTISYSRPFGIRGVDANYMFLAHVHAWPNPDCSVTVKLLPWAITVTEKGEIFQSNDHVAWSPVIHSEKPLSTLKLAEASVCALDDGLDPRSGFGTTPYLITTLQTDSDIHFISSLWHKKLSIGDIEHLDRHELEERLEDENIATLLLSACEDEIPPLNGLASLVLSQLEEAQGTRRIPPLLEQHQDQILQLFRQVFPAALKEFVEDKCSSQYHALSEMYDILEKLKLMPSIASAFFDAMDDTTLSFDERQMLVAKCLHRIVHVMPKWMKALMPEHLIMQPLSLRESILYAEPAAAVFLIDRAPAHFFSAKNLIALFERFHSDSQVVFSLLERMGGMEKRLGSLSDNQKEKLAQAIAPAINTETGTCHKHLLKIYRDGIELPIKIEKPYVDFIGLLGGPNLQIQSLSETLAEHAGDENREFCGFLSNALECYSKQHMFPMFLHMMAAINCSDNQNDLMLIVNAIDDDLPTQLEREGANGKFKLIETIWHAADKLDTSYRKTFAIVLLAAIQRCYGEHALAPGFQAISCNPMMTAEAMLLQENRSSAPQPIQEMQECITISTPPRCCLPSQG